MNTPVQKTAYVEVEYSTGSYPFIDSAEVEIDYLQYGEDEEHYKEIQRILVSERVPERYVDSIKQQATETFHNGEY